MNSNNVNIPVLIGRGMANNAKIDLGDTFTIRWLDSDQTYDADEGTVVHIMDTENFKIDIGHIWVPIEKAQSMLSMENEATYVVHAKKEKKIVNTETWIHRDENYLIYWVLGNTLVMDLDMYDNEIKFLGILLAKSDFKLKRRRNRENLD